jgi:hypothetical protein
MECRGHLDEPLQKGFLRKFCVQPDLFPCFVCVEELFVVKERYPVLENGCLFGVFAGRMC